MVAQLREVLALGWGCTLLAVEGSVTTGDVRHVRLLPPGVTHLVVSVDGNDALGYTYLPRQRAGSVAGVLGILGDAQDQFASNYALIIRAVSANGLALTLCTIQDTTLRSRPATAQDGVGPVQRPHNASSLLRRRSPGRSSPDL